MSLKSKLQGIVNKVFDNTLIPGFETAKTATLSGETAPTHNPTTGTKSGTPFSHSIQITQRPATLQEVSQGGGLIEVGDKFITVQNSGLTNGLKASYQITIGSQVWAINDILPVELSGDVIQYQCLCKKA